MLEPTRVNLAIFIFFLTVEIWLLENPKKHITFSHFEIIFSQVTKILPGKKKKKAGFFLHRIGKKALNPKPPCTLLMAQNSNGLRSKHPIMAL